MTVSNTLFSSNTDEWETPQNIYNKLDKEFHFNLDPCATQYNPNTTIVLLIPSRTDTKFFHEWICGKAELRFVKGRIKFSNSKYNAPFPSLIAIYKQGNNINKYEGMEQI